ncbi:DNA internalization-related competence protein ComEC/Rec2 [Desertibacillus haloalkaliphilus]|uniref:DNA internalization-related competence protein ComEC/Rec2 n=1 Tax=Desertibacillus haloalkaliphilus TaxID=1328930 RepID=UPI001C25811A|nr:DNA internalization-related competence protein ComEC/Rec2 [Desertibacillus haloalkaliphilus]MBU8905621.1 DNA internalization-related competence protein ComEC/Rec2 [Desertibacillus haloalkaliphilus]
MEGRWIIAVFAAMLGIVSRLNGIFNIWFAVLAFSLLCFVVLRRGLRTQLLLTSFLFFILLYFTVDGLERNNTSVYTNFQPTKIIGKLTSIPEIDGDRLSFRFTSSAGELLQVFYYFKSEKEQQQLSQLSYGMTCSFSVVFDSPSIASNFHAFDYKDYLYYQRIHWIVTPTTIDLAQCVQHDFTPYDYIQQFRQHGLSYIDNHFPEQLAGIVTSLVYGERQLMDADVLNAYQSLGIIHLLAVSGLHVGLVTACVFYLLLRIGVIRERAMDVLLLMLPLYMIIAGAAPSVIRASLMAMTVLIIIRFKKSIHPLDGISLVCILLLLFNPYYLFQLGFQLSFLVSYSLLLSAETIRGKYSSYFGQLLAVTCISQLVSLPLILYHFYEFSLWSLPLNLIYIPFISLFILPFAFITLLTHLLMPLVGEFFVLVLDYIVRFAHEWLLLLTEQNVGTLLFGKISDLGLVIAYLLLIYGFICWEQHRSWKRYIVPVCGLLAAAVVQWNLPYFLNQGEITMIDVGQGDSMLIDLPYRKEVYLIDGGGQVSIREEEEWRARNRSFDVGHDILLPYLKAKGIRKIDRLILTHGHYDHIGGIEALIDQVIIDKVYYPKGEVAGDFEQHLLNSLHQADADVLFVSEGKRWRVANDMFAIVSPVGNEQSLNDRSIVLYAVIDGVRWLFTGDLEKSGEERLIHTYENLPVDVLKAGHHGSHTSSTDAFLDHIKPKVALISAGKNNRYGHPHSDLIENFEERGIAIYRTDENGAIRFKIGKRQQNFETATSE